MQVNINWDKFDSKKYKPLYHETIPDFKPGTLAYDDYWDQQDEYCLKGYKPNVHMPKIVGSHYFYLNMCKIRLLPPGGDRKVTASPFYRELDRRLFNEISNARKYRHGLIVGKPRRVGLSYVGAVSVLHEMLLYREAQIGVAAGQEDKATDFYKKVSKMHEDIRPEYRSSVLTKNDEEYTLGYSTYENKQRKSKGLLSSLYIKTMYAKPTGFEGKSFSMAIFEEAGLFQDLIAAYKSTEPCFKEGSIMFGTPIVYGTGGDIEKDSKGYMKMWKNHEAYNLKKVLVLATDYYPGDGVPDPETGKSISFFDLKTGRTDSNAALQYILEERKQKEGSEGFIKHLQSYPIKESEIFIKSSGGYLNRKKINAQIQNLPNCPFLIKVGRLEWTTNDPITEKLASRAKNLKEKDKIHFNRKSKVKFVEDPEFGTVVKLLDPIKRHGLSYCPDLAGCDSYDEEIDREQSKKKISDGATLVYRTFYSMKEPSDLPVAYILDRGDATADDTFFSQNLRCAVYYGYELLVEYTKTSIINYFTDCGARDKHLMDRPEIEGYNSSASNPVGFKMPNQHAWKLTLRLLKREVNENFGNIWFEEVLNQLLNYGEENSDLGSAYAMALVAKLSIFPEETEGIEYDDTDENYLLDMDAYIIENGTRVKKSFREIYQEKENENDFNHFIQDFDPEHDLDEEDLLKYEEEKTDQKIRIKTERQKILERYDNDVMAFAINDFLEENKKK
jgi:hypothetical protein